MDQSAKGHWLAVYHCLADGKHFSLHHFNLLLRNIGNPEDILSTSPGVYEKAGMNEGFYKAIQAYQKGRSYIHRRVEEDIAWMENDSNFIVVAGSKHYPRRLGVITDPPPLFYLQGSPEALQGDILAMVGSRKPSLSGRRLARRFARELAERGITTSSGLAYGIDSESHLGSLEAEGKTVAVLGGGLNKLYPKANQSLADSMLAHGGCLLSEYPLDFAPRPWCFPLRNRVITGLSRGVLVVEAALKSGSLVSARCALEQGREVYAIPGHIDSPQSRGCHQLIREGACLVESVQDILADWSDLFSGENSAGGTGRADNQGGNTGGSDEEQQVLRALGAAGQNTDSLARITGKEVSALSAILGALEMKGLVRREGSTYCRSG
jgi:DNA processing protein